MSGEKALFAWNRNVSRLVSLPSMVNFALETMHERSFLFTWLSFFRLFSICSTPGDDGVDSAHFFYTTELFLEWKCGEIPWWNSPLYLSCRKSRKWTRATFCGTHHKCVLSKMGTLSMWSFSSRITKSASNTAKLRSNADFTGKKFFEMFHRKYSSARNYSYLH